MGFDAGCAVSSSEVFETSLSAHLASFADRLFVLSGDRRGGTGERSEGNKRIILGQSFYAPDKTLAALDKELLFPEYDTVVLFYGYHPATLSGLLKIRKKYGFKLFSYTFDIHSISGNPLKRLLGNIYLGSGIRMLNFTDGVLLLNEEAVRGLSLRVPHFVSRIGSSGAASTAADAAPLKAGRVSLLYSGAFEEYNGIRELMAAARELPEGVTVRICGNGRLEEYVKKEAAENPAAEYLGYLSPDKLAREILSADILLNLRNPGSRVCAYSFPSKMISYLASGKRIVTTEFPCRLKLSQMCYTIKDLKPESISGGISAAISDEKPHEKIRAAQSYIKKYCDWEDISREIADFMFGCR